MQLLTRMLKANVRHPPLTRSWSSQSIAARSGRRRPEEPKPKPSKQLLNVNVPRLILVITQLWGFQVSYLWICVYVYSFMGPISLTLNLQSLISKTWNHNTTTLAMTKTRRPLKTAPCKNHFPQVGIIYQSHSLSLYVCGRCHFLS